MIEKYSENYFSAPNLRMERIYSDLRQIAAAEHIIRENSSQILEVGCSGMPIANYLVSRINSEHVINCHVVEPDTNFVELAISNLIQNDYIATYFINDLVENLDSSEYKFDFIVVNSLLQEIADTQSFLSKLTSLLSENGKIWINVPNANSIHNVIYQNEEEANKVDHKTRFGRKRSYTISTLKSDLLAAGIQPKIVQSRILKPFWDFEMEKFLHAESKEAILEEWLGFHSAVTFVGAELDMLCSFSC